MIKLNTKYKPLITSNKRYYVVSGGRASGKSYSIAAYLLALTLEKGNVILFARYTMTSVQISIFPEFLDKIETLGLTNLFEITKNSILNKVTGSKIIFKGIKTGSNLQTANLKSISNLNVIVIDEAEEIPDEATFDKIDLSARRNDKDNKVIVIFNPTTKAHWLYQRFFESTGIQPGECRENDDTVYIHSSFLDNKKYLSESILKQFAKLETTNKDKYDHIVMGAFLDVAEGVIFNNWSYGEFPDVNDYYFGLDFGFSPDPDALVKVHINEYEKKIYIDECIYSTKLSTPDLTSQIKHFAGNKLIIADNQANRLINELESYGLSIEGCTKGAGSIEEGLKLLQDYKLIITPTSNNIAKELNNYIWSNKKAGAPRDMYNHAIDAIRYIVTHLIKENSNSYTNYISFGA
jgi:phage terminase large subunit